MRPSTPIDPAQIAIEKQRKQKEAQQREEERKEQARKEAERKQKEEADKREQAEKQRLEDEKERKAKEEQKRKAAAALKPDARHCLELGVIDGIVPEPGGGAHLDHAEAATLLGQGLAEALDEVGGLDSGERIGQRRAKFRAMGVYTA